MLLEDIKEIYNSLIIFNEDIIESPRPQPIKVYYEKDSRLLVFELKGKSVRLWTPIYYSLGLDNLIKYTYLLPEGYDYLMSELKRIIDSGLLIKDRTVLSPENYGFDIYAVNQNELWKGPEIKANIIFISGHGWLFRWLVRRKYKL
jgi:hypothetical protein